MQAFLSGLTQFSAALDQTVTLAELLRAMHEHAHFVLSPESEEGVQALLQRDDLARSAHAQLQLMERLLRESRLHGIDRAGVLLAARVLIVRLAAAKDSASRIAIMKERGDVVGAVDEEILRIATHPPDGAPPTPQAFAVLCGLFGRSQQGDVEGAVAEFERAAAQVPTGESEEVLNENAAGAETETAHRSALLVGHWRHTDALSSREVSVVTDHHLVIKPEGIYEAWSHTVSAAASYESTSEIERGRWQLVDDRLSLVLGEMAEHSHIAVDGRNLLMKDWGSRRIWERVR